MEIGAAAVKAPFTCIMMKATVDTVDTVEKVMLMCRQLVARLV
jgi:hypothetical protein